MSLRPSTVYRYLARVREKLQTNTSIALLQATSADAVPKGASLTLSPRGIEVFHLTLQGVNDKRIAVLLGISYSCVRRHKEKMLLRNNCISMMELVAKYYGQIDDAAHA